MGELTEPLVHSIGVLRPRAKVILEHGELLRVGGDVRGVFVEEDLTFVSNSSNDNDIDKGDLLCRMPP